MAVVSISRIQIRRGKEQSGSGLPQLASGELGWAIDTQNLYVGNGSVSEGAPYVGNTRILTEADNLFELQNLYTYKEDTIAGTFTRDLQDRLDDRVSVRAFGAAGDNGDVTNQLQTAIYQLYLNTAPNEKAILYVDPGEYTISDTIYLPKNTKLVGAGIGKTIINVMGDVTAFWTVNNNTTATTPAWSLANDADTDLQPSGIHISGITFSNNNTTTGPFIHLYNCKHSVIDNCEFNGNFDTINFGDLDGSSNPNIRTNAGIKITSDSKAIYSENNQITGCKFYDLYAGVYSDDYILNTNIHDNDFDTAVYGVVFSLGKKDTSPDANLEYPTNNLVENNTFDKIYANGIAVFYGLDNVSKNNTFYDVGNRFAGASAWTTANFFAAIKFVQSSNISVDDYFERAYILTTGSNKDGSEQINMTGTTYVPDVEGPVNYSDSFIKTVTVQDTSSAVPLFRVPADDIKTYHLDYVYSSTARIFKRFGVLTITVDPSTSNVDIVDDYNIVGNDNYAENIDWIVDFTGSTVTIETINPGDVGVLTFRSHIAS